MKAVELVNVGIESSTGAPLVLLRENEEPHRLLPVFIGAFEASSIALAFGGAEPPRPLSHDLMVSLVDRLDAQIRQVELTGFDDETFFAEVVLAGPKGDERVDSRPSDAIALAVRTGAPVFVSEEVLEAAGAAQVLDVVDAEAIDQEVDDFREFLEGVDPTDFATAALPPAEPDTDLIAPEGADDELGDEGEDETDEELGDEPLEEIDEEPGDEGDDGSDDPSAG